jgi:hypothetical protein
VRRAAEAGRAVRVVGHGHSSTALVQTEDLLISLDRLSGLLQVDRDACVATPGAGTQLDEAGRLLQRAISCLYLTLSIFVGTSVAIGVVAAGGPGYSWLPIVLGIVGAALLFAASLLLIGETRLALRSVNFEMDFVLRFGRHYAPQLNSAAQVEQRSPRNSL